MRRCTARLLARRLIIKTIAKNNDNDNTNNNSRNNNDSNHYYNHNDKSNHNHNKKKDASTWLKSYCNAGVDAMLEWGTKGYYKCKSVLSSPRRAKPSEDFTHHTFGVVFRVG